MCGAGHVQVTEHITLTAESAWDEVLARRATRGRRVRYIRDEGRGLSRARNLARAEARTPLLAFIDDDCVATPQWLATIVAAFGACPSLTAVTGPVLPLGPPDPERVAVSSRTSREQRLFQGDVLPWLVGTGGNFALRTYLIPANEPLFDPRLGAGSDGRAGEDIDVLRRLLRRGHTILYARDAVVLHERQTLARRARSRFGYGHGVGAAIALWGRGGDTYAARALAGWLRLRFRLMAVAVRRRDRRGFLEEVAMIRGTLCGLLYGVRTQRAA